MDDQSTEIVKAVISLGHSLGLLTVAEGIETPGQLEMLRTLGCDAGQGYHLAAPAAGDSLVLLVERMRSPR